jgi:hypothetical protein
LTMPDNKKTQKIKHLTQQLVITSGSRTQLITGAKFNGGDSIKRSLEIKQNSLFQ